MKYFPLLFFLACSVMGSWHDQLVNTSDAGYTDLAMDNTGNLYISHGTYWLYCDYSTYCGWYNWEMNYDPTYLYTSVAVNSPSCFHLSCNHNEQLAYHNGYDLQVLDSACHGNTSLALTSGELPAIAYYGDSDVKYVSWDGSQWNAETVCNDIGGSVVSLAFNSQNQPQIAVARFNWLGYAAWNGSQWDITEIDSSCSFQSEGISLQFDSSGNPHIACRRDDDLYYYSFHDNQWSWEILDSGRFNALTSATLVLDTDDNPHVACNAVTGSTSTIVYLHNDGTGWSIEDLSSGSYPSIIIDSFGDPAIAYSQDTNCVRYLCHNTVGIFGDPVETELTCSVFPNPCRGSVKLQATLPEPGNAGVILLDLSGRIVHSRELTDLPAGAVTLQVELCDVPSGIYIFRMTTSEYSAESLLTVLR